ncbi:hypothetical protein H5410_060778, partial [Solanum commersonii]
ATYPVSNAFLSDTHLSYEDQPTNYPTHSLELSAISLVVLVSRPPSQASRKHMGGFKSTGYKKLNLELSYGRIKKTHFQFREDELLSSSVHKTLSKLEGKI